MKKILLPKKDGTHNYYRANLHCHTTLSDGKKTPQQIKDMYKSRGYSVVAFTDHDVFITHNDLTDSEFVALGGVELEVNEENSKRTCHMCFIAKDPGNHTSFCYHRSKYLWGNAEGNRNLLYIDESEPDYERTYNAACINDMMKTGHEKGFFVTYNHPTWSLESYPQYMSYNGMDAMEIVNYGSVVEGCDEFNGHCYDDMIRGGKRLYCIAADDNHNYSETDSPDCDSFGGYTMISAERLDYKNIIESLESGMFYCACGTTRCDAPEIKYLEYDDGRIYIETSPSEKINFITDTTAYSKRGHGVTEAQFSLDDRAKGAKWFRLEITDERGNRAFTNAYFADMV